MGILIFLGTADVSHIGEHTTGLKKTKLTAAPVLPALAPSPLGGLEGFVLAVSRDNDGIGIDG